MNPWIDLNFLNLQQFFVMNGLLTSLMTGVIWLVQLVHYPLFLGLDHSTFPKWHQFHSRKITLIVAPLMVLELLISFLLFLGWPMAISILFFVLTLFIWACTFFISVPLHNCLEEKGFELKVIRKLINTNWLRTGLYSVKFIFVCVSLFSPGG